ncbi:DUF6090 family protein [Lacinutrix iliipiscaria]|uniref:DUF6090 family protein n=1 Tax=Lacinutrix iliipiscaria TaxID=1230532 RepID=A0ABW5WMV8_9FLAO
MISVLRKIRKKFVVENRVSKYLLYAIGEIILVVIGILLALQINTWKKEKTNHDLKVTLLKNVKSDLIIQKELIEEQIVFEESIMSKINTLNQLAQAKSINAAFVQVLFEISTRKTFKANRTTFNNMISTGDITLLAKSDLQQEIIRYYQRLDYSESVTNNNNLFNTDSHYGAFVASNALGLEIEENSSIVLDKELSKTDRYLIFAQLKGRHGNSESINAISKNLLERTEELIQSIDKELK